MLSNSSEGKNKSFFQKMIDEVKILSNITFILNKLEKESFLDQMQDIFGKVIKNEIIFAIKGRLTRAAQNRAPEAQLRHQAPDFVQHVHLQGEPQNHLQLPE